ncbi:TIGR02147 family protein [Bdellovibrio bacteriovorus]|uniref:TIGR02147 family protein n=1 Tax=Bdellovibrio TaxID=958 RepID=UPI0035A96187
MRNQFPQLLKDLLAERQGRNPRYSKRSFAKSCGISIGQLNDYFSNRRNCSLKTAMKIAYSLGLSEEQMAKIQTQFKKDKATTSSFSADKFSVFSDPAHFALLALTTASDFKLDPQWISEKLKISEESVQDILANLQTLGLISVQENKVTVGHEHILAALNAPSEVAHSAHKASLKRVTEKIDSVPVEKRELSSLSVCIDPKKLPLAKERIHKFMERTARFLESGDKKEVYEINVQIFPW